MPKYIIRCDLKISSVKGVLSAISSRNKFKLIYHMASCYFSVLGMLLSRSIMKQMKFRTYYPAYWILIKLMLNRLLNVTKWWIIISEEFVVFRDIHKRYIDIMHFSKLAVTDLLYSLMRIVKNSSESRPITEC